MKEQDKIKESMQELFQCVGHTLFTAQLMEKELAFLLLIPEIKEKYKLPSEKSIYELASEEIIHETIRKLNKITFGTLIKKLKTTGIMDTDSGELLQEALDERNFLAHHFFDHYQGKMNDLETHKIMHERLSNMKEIFTDVFDGLHQENLRIMKIIGINNEA